MSMQNLMNKNYAWKTREQLIFETHEIMDDILVAWISTWQ